MKNILQPYVLFFALFMLLIPATKLKAEQSHLPEFSWDRVPVCIHLANHQKDFSEKQLEFIARFPLVCIEKMQAIGKYGNMEKGTAVASKGIKKYNKDAKILFYWNSRIDYSSLYSYGDILKENPSWKMTDVDGMPITVHSATRNTYDTTIESFRDWWVSVPSQQIKTNENLDGVFVDAVLQYVASADAKKKTWGEQKYNDTKKGLYTMLENLRESIGDDKIILANSLRGIEKTFPNMGRDFFNYTDGAMMEHFAAISGAKKEVIANDIALIQEAARNGKMVVVKGWPSFNFQNMSSVKVPTQKNMEKIAKGDITFPLACFLVAAGEQSYFCYSWGYSQTQGGMIDYPEYNRPLGKPNGEAKQNGYIYTREFEHCSVWVDIEKREALINWKNI